MAIQVYQCEVCLNTYPSLAEANKCEEAHYAYLTKKRAAYLKSKHQKLDFCYTCRNHYLVYGCELNCRYSKICNSSNHYKHWKDYDDGEDDMEIPD